MKLPIYIGYREGKMKSIIVLLLFINPIAIQASEEFKAATDCLEYEYELAKDDYKYSELAKVLEFESFLKLRCEPILQTAISSLPEKNKYLKKSEVLDLTCPNCLRFQVLWDSSGIKKVGIKRNNVFLMSKEY